MSLIRKKTIAGLAIGDTFCVSRTFAEEDVVRFADISQDYNPVHFDERFTSVKGLDGRICHGLLVASLLTEVGGQIGWLASGMSFKFKGPVYIGETITCRFTITDMDARGRTTANAVFNNQKDITVLEAVVTGIVPGSSEKEVMKQMVAEGDPTNKIPK